MAHVTWKAHTQGATHVSALVASVAARALVTLERVAIESTAASRAVRVSPPREARSASWVAALAFHSANVVNSAAVVCRRSKSLRSTLVATTPCVAVSWSASAIAVSVRDARAAREAQPSATAAMRASARASTPAATASTLARVASSVAALVSSDTTRAAVAATKLPSVGGGAALAPLAPDVGDAAARGTNALMVGGGPTPTCVCCSR